MKNNIELPIKCECGHVSENWRDAYIHLVFECPKLRKKKKE